MSPSAVASHGKPEVLPGNGWFQPPQQIVRLIEN